jgi:hypothetical protein
MGVGEGGGDKRGGKETDGCPLTKGSNLSQLSWHWLIKSQRYPLSSWLTCSV